MCDYGISYEIHNVAALLMACGDDTPDTLLPPVARFAACALRNLSVYHNVSYLLFRKVIGRRQTGFDKQKVFVIPITKSLGNVDDIFEADG
jgi:hypothetical protein